MKRHLFLPLLPRTSNPRVRHIRKQRRSVCSQRHRLAVNITHNRPIVRSVALKSCGRSAHHTFVRIDVIKVYVTVFFIVRPGLSQQLVAEQTSAHNACARASVRHRSARVADHVDNIRNNAMSAMYSLVNVVLDKNSLICVPPPPPPTSISLILSGNSAGFMFSFFFVLFEFGFHNYYMQKKDGLSSLFYWISYISALSTIFVSLFRKSDCLF